MGDEMKTTMTIVVLFLMLVQVVGIGCAIVALPVYMAPVLGVLNLFGLYQGCSLIWLIRHS